MPLQYSQFIWGFEVFDSSSDDQNDQLYFRRPAGGGGFDDAVTIAPGVYTPDEIAYEIQEKMKDVNGNSYDVTFDYETLKFSFSGTNGFDLQMNTGPGAGIDASALLGFTAGTKTYTPSTPVESDDAVSAIDPPPDPEIPVFWSPAEPLLYTTPATPVALATDMAPAGGTQRIISAMQRISDGGSVESVHFNTIRVVSLTFRALAADEAEKMESFLDWISMGKRFTWQPDKTSGEGMKLVLANPGAVTNAYEWLTRPEVGYGTFTFIEQLS